MGINLATMLRESAAACPDKPLLETGGEPFTYRQVDEASGRIAASLRALGLAPGAKVAVHLPNVAEFVLTYFGVLKAGLVLVPLNPALRAAEIAYHLADSEAELMVTSAATAAEVTAAATEVSGVRCYVVGATGAEAPPPGTQPFEALLRGPGRVDTTPTGADDTAVLLYTSGTTGTPKGAELTHFQLYMNCTVAGELLGYTQRDVTVGVLPLFHVFGLSSVLNTVVRFGATLVLVPKFDAAAVLDAIEKHRCTVFAGVPTMFFALVREELTDRDLSSLRAANSGGAAIPEEILRAFEARVPGVAILEGYGLSETASAATFNISAAQRKIGSVGKPIWGVEVAVLDQDDRELPPGSEHVGEIVIRGHNVMKGYYRCPGDTAEAIRDGWLRTGDLGYRDADGYLFVVDRKKDLIIRGGYNVYPREVEEVLYTHPAVAEAAVIGRPDPRLGEEIVAVVASKPGKHLDAGDLIGFARKRLAGYKCPREVRIVDQLPKGPTGKIRKADLRSAVSLPQRPRRNLL
ncbi:long-chain fatty acid--CoA ligase [Amycolatopsis halotolerans]|uniref:Long-chain fatty acid--CoA ligase n=1 Tax=Amycolatopsis halotolerans TaxID=330083 RepID=A0ABV7QF47_9PSEU